MIQKGLIIMASTKGGIIAAKKNEVQQAESKKGLQSLVMSMLPQIARPCQRC